MNKSQQIGVQRLAGKIPHRGWQAGFSFESAVQLIPYHWMAGLTCGMFLLQAGGCTTETIMNTLVQFTISALLSALFGTPVVF